MRSRFSLLWGLAFVTPSTLFAAPSAPAPVAPIVTEAHVDFLRSLHRINEAEIEAGGIAEQRGTRPAVRDYGHMLIFDHKEADAKVMEVATKNAIDLNAAESPALQSLDAQLTLLQRQLTQATPRSFDSLFAQKMTAGHDDAISLVRNAQRTLAPLPDFTQLEDELLPTLRKHRDMAAVLTEPSVAH